MREVTALVVNFNGGDLLIRAIASILKCPSVTQIIVTDNGSSDNSIEKLPSLPYLTILQNEHNCGFSAANNAAIALTRTPYLLFINPDCELNEPAIQAMLSLLEATPDVGMCGPLILNEDGSEQRACRRDEPTPLAALKTLIGNREKGINKVGKPLPAGPVEVDAISGACMLVRREALEDVGPLDEGYFLHCEDLDWCKRFWLKGWKVMFLPHVPITHAKGGSSQNRRVRVEWHKHKGMARYYRKFYADQYPRILMYGVYAAIWARFFLLTPVWLLQSLRR